MKGLFAAAPICALLIAAPAFAQNAATPGAAGTRTLSQQDKTFVQQAGAGNLGEADLGQLAMQKGDAPGIREFGRWMYTDHGLIGNKWLTEIMTREHEHFHPTLSAQSKDLRQKLEGISGAQFDREYIDAQVTVHEKTIPVFEKEAADGRNVMIKNYAQFMTPVLQQHLSEAKALAGESGVATARGLSPREQSGSSTQR